MDRGLDERSDRCGAAADAFDEAARRSSRDRSGGFLSGDQTCPPGGRQECLPYFFNPAVQFSTTVMGEAV